MWPAAGIAALRQCAAAAAASPVHCRALPVPLQHLQSLLFPPPSPCAWPPARGYAAAAQALESEPEPASAPERREPPHSVRPFTPLRFDDPATAFRTKTSGELALAYATFTACQIKPLVDNADGLLKWSKRLLGEPIVNGILRRTFFRHFCAGESQEDIRPRVRALYEAGIGSILDYAAEDDLGAEADGAAMRSDGKGSAVARTFEYNTEAICDAHMRVFLQSISAAAEAPGQGFAAIKVTALGNPKLLERVSAGLLAIKNLFSRFDLDHDDVITREEFSSVYAELFDDSSPERLQQLFAYLDAEGSGVVDMLSWSRRVRLQDVPRIIQRCRAPGPLAFSALSEEELALLDALMARLYKCAEAAAAGNVRLMIDAEHSWFQPAIDHAATELQRAFNTRTPTILNTYQCYLRDSRERFALDLERSRREGFKFGAKLVRGAYMFLEREKASKSGRPSPVWDSIQDTHANYDRIVQDALTAVEADGAEVMIASHNQSSVEAAVSTMHERGLDHTSAGVYFGQLLGMADPLTFVLGAHGYRAYKYVPFGRVDEVIPYLVRRAQENSTVLGGVQAEKVMVLAELRRRMAGGDRHRPAARA